MTWHMHAGRTSTGRFTHPGTELHVTLYGHTPVPVVVTETEAGPYWGWLATGEEDPSMIWPNWGSFSVCFTYGPEAEEARGRGRILRLGIEEEQ